MVISFTECLQDALKCIRASAESVQLAIDSHSRIRTEETIQQYGDAKWKIVDILNRKYSTILKDKFDLYNWLDYNENDEVAYFLNEAGSNTLHYSEFKAPSRFHLWLGERGFVIGIEQQGKGFNAQKIDAEKIKENEGAAFEFFRKCKSTVFFDDPREARIIYLLHPF